jgi:hypothetical protein
MISLSHTPHPSNSTHTLHSTHDDPPKKLFSILSAITIVCALLTATAVLLSLIYMREKTRACVSGCFFLFFWVP